MQAWKVARNQAIVDVKRSKEVGKKVCKISSKELRKKVSKEGSKELGQ